MPELPEVQTIVSDLDKVLPGLKVRDVWTDLPRLWLEDLIGKKFLSIERRGKNILMHLSGGKTLLVHQKMTGHMLYGSLDFTQGKWLATKPGPLRDDPQNRFIHLVFSLSDGKHLALSDVRKFAKVLVCETDKLDELKDVKDIGPDPLDKSFSFKEFKEILSSRKGRIKEALMKQEIISGIGNIYASEILWEAGVHPFRKIETINEKELKNIYGAIRKILRKALQLRGDSVVDYRDLFGEKGGYQMFHKAYQREGEKCPKKDGGVIKRVKKGGRSSFFCSVHQKKIKNDILKATWQTQVQQKARVEM